MKRIFAVSGNGQGAGKTTAAKTFADQTYSIAGAMRSELARKYHSVDWYRTDQAYKDETTVYEYGRDPDSGFYYTVRQILTRYGQQMCQGDPTYWVDKLVDHIKAADKVADMRPSIAIDDVRKVCELDALKNAFNGKVIHIHVLGTGAKYEPIFEGDALHALADYVVEW